MIQPGRPQATIKCDIDNVHISSRLPKAGIQRHILIILVFNAYCFLID